ncbi:iron permease (plasmid) [Sphingopyxis fribergensis]|uniref:Iron permease n=1 Tax=Sphingopyxis fribergensis TaxID=1515612 RepID=A0A0A7PNK5_9SPHN|nr:cytochrome c/FTR1 family iron permease [Sphingopyxis fribergensis]AJA11584.1 iron permease [Sphingopyxis fribergensis]
MPPFLKGSASRGAKALGRSILAALLIALLFLQPARASEPEVQTVWRLLDYIAVDYPGAVSNGRVISEAEYAEMVEFSGQVETRLKRLPQKTAKPALLARAAKLSAAIGARSAPAAVAEQSHQLADALLASYPVPLAPKSAPDLARGATLYRENCAVCHGAGGAGDGPNAAQLDPPPIAFTDLSRARERSLFALYQVISQGLEGTSMASFDSLPEADRWALAFYVGSLAYPDSSAPNGRNIWEKDAATRAALPNMTIFVGTTPAELAATLGDSRAGPLTAYLRRQPQALEAKPAGSLAFARQRLEASMKAYSAGDRKRASDLALSAYLDGFEPVEPVLAARDSDLMAEIEMAMGNLRSAIGKGSPIAEVEAANAEVARLFVEAEAALAPEQASASSSFLGAFGVLLREGLEALLIVIAMMAFLRKTGRTDVMGYVHGGWVSALAAGALTWFVATYFIGISGASRELTEGFGSLFAAIILISVGIWMHGKSNAEAWQRYIKEKISAALSRRSAWFLFGLTFLVVYREVFETILFYAALWAQGNGGALLAGAGAAVVLLGMIAWALLRYSARLPITQFFSWSAALIAILAVVLAGKGIGGLQEAGLIGVTPLAGFPRIPMMGVYPTIQTVLAQLAAAMVLATGFWYNRARAPGVA